MGKTIRVSAKQARTLSRQFGINHQIVPFKQFLYGLNVELEHGTVNQLTNVTNDDLILTAKITIANFFKWMLLLKIMFT